MPFEFNLGLGLRMSSLFDLNQDDWSECDDADTVVDFPLDEFEPVANGVPSAGAGLATAEPAQTLTPSSSRSKSARTSTTPITVQDDDVFEGEFYFSVLFAHAHTIF